MDIAVIGLGKIGLPLAVQFARSGHRVVGADINESVVESVMSSEAPFPGELDLGQFLAEVVANGTLTATSETSKAVAHSDAVVVVVPLYVTPDGKPDFRAMDAATQAVGAGLAPNTLVIYETTLPVGTTRNRWRPMLESASGLVEGSDFHLVYSPERVMSGRIFADLRRYPKLIGALSESGARRAAAFYQSVLQFDPRPDLDRPNGVWDLGAAESAEMAKLAETTYRDVNIALVNQFARYAESNNIDLYQVIEACNSQPYSHLHRPGIAVGGHCIPVYPQLYLWNDPAATLVSVARRTNESMPAYAVELAASAVGGSLDGKRVVVLGAAYRGGVKEIAFSGVFGVVEALHRAHADVLVHDPLYSPEELAAYGWKAYQFGEKADVAIVQADHADYARMSVDDIPGVEAVVDGRRMLDPSRFDSVKLLVIGQGMGEA